MVFNLYAIDGYSHKEIAEMMGISDGTSKSNLARARKILQDKIIEFGYIGKEYVE
jgi:RNA polymerase sigma-70 factor (ECF subfamily)